MKRQLPNTIYEYGLKFAMKKNDFERLKPSSGKKRNFKKFPVSRSSGHPEYQTRSDSLNFGRIWLVSELVLTFWALIACTKGLSNLRIFLEVIAFIDNDKDGGDKQYRNNPFFGLRGP